jgi:hypothetical protein
MNHHPSFIRPEDDTKIWHYMDFIKFVSLLERQSLFFSTVGILREADMHEGTYNAATLEAHKQKPFSIYDIGSGLLRTFGKFLAINCWHMNEIESVAMWNVYLKGVPGIAIQSSMKRFDESIQHSISGRDVMIGKVHYLDENEPISEPDGFNGLDAVLWKWKSYQYENELRAVIISRLEELYKYNGIYVPVKVNELIEKIVISPKSPTWFSELVLAIATKYELGDKVMSSRLDEKPKSIDTHEFTVAITCPSCDTTQEIVLEPFLAKDYPNNSTVVFSADRVTIQCRNCLQSLHFSLHSANELNNSA